MNKNLHDEAVAMSTVDQTKEEVTQYQAHQEQRKQ